MFDIYNFVITNLFPYLPSDLYYLVPIACLIILVMILFACCVPFFFLFAFIKRS